MDPTKPLPIDRYVPPEEETQEATMEAILKKQLEIAGDIQNKLLSEIMEPREYKELISAASSIVTTAHRTDEAMRTIEAYKLFAETVMEFLRSRTDQVGEDLVAELKRVGKTLKYDDAVDQVVSNT